jgi:SAM-dependent methyltransferase
MRPSYDLIGLDYSDLRRPDPRIAAAIERALGPASSVLNVGAGAGSYEPAGREVTAVEPSMEMIRQRRVAAGSVVQGHAEHLPFDDGSFDAAMAILTVHHWTDQERGIREMRRVTRGPIVVLTFDPAFRGFWLADYIPVLVALDEAQMPKMAITRRGSARSRFRQFRSRTIARTDSSAPIGADPPPISIRRRAPQCPPSGRSATYRRR